MPLYLTLTAMTKDILLPILMDVAETMERKMLQLELEFIGMRTVLSTFPSHYQEYRPTIGQNYKLV